MCGIFGSFDDVNPKKFYDLGKMSESRGKEASGYLFFDDKELIVKKYLNEFSQNLVKKELFEKKNNIPSKSNYIGHTRLKTHGDINNNLNNQPVSSMKNYLVHNGIVLNYLDLIEKFDLTPKSNLDSEVIVLSLNYFLKNKVLQEALIETIKNLYGEVSIAGTFNSGEKYFLYSNTGSIYYLKKNNNLKFFCSEEWIAKKLKKKYKIEGEILQIDPNQGLILDKSGAIEKIFFQKCLGSEKNVVTYKDIIKKLNNTKSYLAPKLKRCSNCILPETVPFIKFNSNDVCNYCEEYIPITYKEKSIFDQLINTENNVIVGFSGGRDSSYGLYLLNKNIKKNIIAVSFDWGMVTDLARRNQARVCGKLGIEHVWLSAKLKNKRKNIKKNLLAWLKNPQLGMVPILMAGDKEWQSQLYKAAKNKNSKYIVQLQNPLEATYFKFGFAGIKPVFKNSVGSGNTFQKIFLTTKLAIYYLFNFIKNPKYLNLSIFDSIKGFFSFYYQTNKILSLFEYIEFDIDEVNQILYHNFSWECDISTTTTWRIGDGTAPIYNYIYWKLAGFTENDFYRSNEIREGKILRNEALKITMIENQPRLERIKEYCELIDLDFNLFIKSIENFKFKSLVGEWEVVNEK